MLTLSTCIVKSRACVGSQQKVFNEDARVKPVLHFLDFVSALMALNHVAAVVVDGAEYRNTAALWAGQRNGGALQGKPERAANGRMNFCRLVVESVGPRERS